EPLVLVTGASGFIATHIVRQLLQAGYRVRGTVRSLSNESKVVPLQKLYPQAKHPLELVQADLLDPACWSPAVDGCTYVLHTASPFPASNPSDENELIKPAVDGTLNVLNACNAANCVKRVVLTSSVAAIFGGFEAESDNAFTEADWPDVNIISPYAKSKTLAEKAAWDFIEGLSGDHFELAVVNPTYVVGPVLCGGTPTSMEVAKRLMEHSMPMLPKLFFPSVDVRDVATAHIKAMTVAEAAGNRHILHAEGLCLSRIAQILSDKFKSQGYNIPLHTAPYALVWLLSWFDKTIQMILPAIGKESKVDNTRMREVLGVEPRNIEDGYIDMVYSLIENGMIKKTSGYQGP
ncbi:putative anthocyanidin reductase, partial [Lamellibrachia satsuma]